MFNLILLLFEILLTSSDFIMVSEAQQVNVILQQGALVGLKIFPDTSRNAVYAFLGVPYAQAPVDELRFAPPLKHPGWNGTLQATSLKPLCPQLTNTIYDETADGMPTTTRTRQAAMDENCLYLNIWVPETALRASSNLPVLAIITGEEMSFDWPRNRITGLDIAAEGAIVVSIQYRSNIFGWMNLDNSNLSGNYGLEDQALALEWIQQNIQNFGGNSNEITLLGHGTSGAPCVLIHLLRQASAAETNRVSLISKAILMSAGEVNATRTKHLEASQILVEKLGCHYENYPRQIVNCLRMKSVGDLLKAFESIYDHGNGSLLLGPVISLKLHEMAANSLIRLPPMMIGITSNEGAFLQDAWLDLARDGYNALESYVNFTILPKVLRALEGQNVTSAQIRDAINWRYFGGNEQQPLARKEVAYLLNAMQRLMSEAFYEKPFYQLLEFLSPTNATQSAAIYAYIFDINSNSMDMRGKVNYFGGAAHSADLPLLFGPSLFQQISRRRFTANEEKICRKMRGAVVSFIKSGNPTPGRSQGTWLPYTKKLKFIYSLGEELEEPNGFDMPLQSAAFERNLPIIQNLIDSGRSRGVSTGSRSRANRNEYNNNNNNQFQLAGIGLTTEQDKSPTSFIMLNQKDSGYARHLRHVYRFWQVFLPNIALYGDDNKYYEDMNSGDALTHRIRLLEASADASRYKQGFFALLFLVCVLLGILSLCVYLLQTDSMTTVGSRRRCSSCCL